MVHDRGGRHRYSVRGLGVFVVIHLRPLPNDHPGNSRLTLQAIEFAACEVFGVDRAVLRVPFGSRKVQHMRFLIWLVARQYTVLSFPQIGLHFDKDHSSVQHGVYTIKEKIADDPNWLDLKRQLENQLQLRGFDMGKDGGRIRVEDDQYYRPRVYDNMTDRERRIAGACFTAGSEGEQFPTTGAQNFREEQVAIDAYHAGKLYAASLA